MTAATLRRLPVLAAVVLLTACGWLAWDTSTRRGAEQAGAEAVAAARESIPAILSYRPETAEQDLTAAARERLTGKFRDDYSQLIATVVVPDARKAGASATATVPAAAVVSADARHAVLLAYVDQTRTAGNDAPAKVGTSMRVTMEKVDARWLISGFDQI